MESKATKAAKESAYKKLLLDAGVSEKRVASVMKVSDIDSIKINEDGSVQDAEKISENVKKEWADFIEVKHERGANVANPPANTGGEITQPSAAALRMQKYQEEHYGKKED